VVKVFFASLAVGTFGESVVTGFAATTKSRSCTMGLDPLLFWLADELPAVVAPDLDVSAAGPEDVTELDVCCSTAESTLLSDCG
jgi:hypothetical protein